MCKRLPLIYDLGNPVDGEILVCTRETDNLHDLRGIEIPGWCPAGSVLPHGEKVSL